MYAALENLKILIIYADRFKSNTSMMSALVLKVVAVESLGREKSLIKSENIRAIT